ncbi:hypothetical protein BDN72DRAFT_407525 [Pluteus cervinus]|uniref:Uncharacterized protein n=1 Tax=Pluteus cervinus TaxID=181527 RepID=A0ACD3B193_9AGAR|nr:hypothetical protein BDN72DRAFT_407525 [Pluteus cervinus]
MESTIPGTQFQKIPQAVLLDGFFQAFLLGAVLCQVLKYRENYHDDARKKKLFVNVLLVFSILQTALEWYKVWRTAISLLRWSTSRIQWADFFINGCICALCQAFFIRRCWKLRDENPWVLYPLAVAWLALSVANLYLAITLGMASQSREYLNQTITHSRYLLPATSVSFSFWVVGSVTLDVVVASLLTWTLSRSRVAPGLRGDSVITQVIRITWTAAVLPPVPMMIAVILYHLPRYTNSHFVPFCALLTGKLYVVGVLHTLNSRERLRLRMASSDTGLGRRSLTNWRETVRVPEFVSAVPVNSNNFMSRYYSAPGARPSIQMPREAISPLDTSSYLNQQLPPMGQVPKIEPTPTYASAPTGQTRGPALL